MSKNKEHINYRYERKFFIKNLDRISVERIILNHPAHFSEIYQERYINNIYFDTIDFENYIDNIDGNMFRTKHRIRWYGDLFTKVKYPVLELKIKKGLVGTKINHKLIPFEFHKGIDSFNIAKIMQDSLIPDLTKFTLKNQNPVICNRYRRKYFLSGDHKFRITIDDDQSFFKFNKYKNYFINEYKDPNNIILELKYDKEDDIVADRISNRIPFRATKSSKYARAVQLLYT